MKRLLPVLPFVLLMSAACHAQHAYQVTLQHYFTAAQVDSILNAHSVPSGALNPVYDVKIYNVLYNTYDADSMPTTASGMMAVPQGTPCEIPIVSYQHDYITRRSDAPSTYGSQWYVGMAAASLGYITVQPDGLGLGTGPGLHPFLHLQSEATSVIDMIRAAKECVDSTGASPDRQLYLAGFAEGGYATLAAHQYIQAYLDSAMHVSVSGAMSGYYDMSGTMVDSMILSPNTYSDPSYLPNLLLSYNRAYNYCANDSDIMIYPYDSILPPLFNGNHTAANIDSRMPSVPNQIMQPVQLDSLANDPTNFFRLLLRKNDAYNWSPTSPVKLFYCIADEVVPYMNSIVAYQHFVANGSTMVDTLDVNPVLTHDLCGQFSVLAAISIINYYVLKPMIPTTSATNCTSSGPPNGSVTIYDTLGDPPYSYRWSTGDSTATVTGLPAGTYYVTSTDQSRCTSVDSVTVSFVNGINALTLANVSVYPNPTRRTVTIDNTGDAEKLSLIELLDINGAVINAPQASNGNITTMDLGEQAKGVYIVHIRSVSGRELHTKVVLL